LECAFSINNLDRAQFILGPQTSGSLRSQYADSYELVKFFVLTDITIYASTLADKEKKCSYTM